MSTKITKEWLIDNEACEAAIIDFNKEYPDGLDLATLSEEELKTAVSKMKYWISWVYYNNLEYVIGLTLRYANLRYANLRRANLRDAKYDNSTEFPDGFDIPDKMVLVD